MERICPSMEEALKKSYGDAVKVTGRIPTTGGSISSASILMLSNGEKVFCKSHAQKHLPMFEAEIHGLEALRFAQCISVARPIAIGCSEQESFILLKLIVSGSVKNDFWEDFGHKLAELHNSFAGRKFGFDFDNFIGSTAQPNSWKDSWLEFFAYQRLDFQTELAWKDRLIPDGLYKKLKDLIKILDHFLAEPETSSFLHGDLWSGNHMVGEDGHVVLIDPAVYCGHFEAELAMTELFGGYPEKFYSAYNEVKKIDAGYKRRKNLYNLYHMLNHVNLFGSSYVDSCQEIVREYM